MAPHPLNSTSTPTPSPAYSYIRAAVYFVLPLVAVLVGGWLEVRGTLPAGLKIGMSSLVICLPLCLFHGLRGDRYARARRGAKPAPLIERALRIATTTIFAVLVALPVLLVLASVARHLPLPARSHPLRENPPTVDVAPPEYSSRGAFVARSWLPQAAQPAAPALAWSTTEAGACEVALDAMTDDVSPMRARTLAPVPVQRSPMRHVAYTKDSPAYVVTPAGTVSLGADGSLWMDRTGLGPASVRSTPDSLDKALQASRPDGYRFANVWLGESDGRYYLIQTTRGTWLVDVFSLNEANAKWVCAVQGDVRGTDELVFTPRANPHAALNSERANDLLGPYVRRAAPLTVSSGKPLGSADSAAR